MSPHFAGKKTRFRGARKLPEVMQQVPFFQRRSLIRVWVKGRLGDRASKNLRGTSAAFTPLEATARVSKQPLSQEDLHQAELSQNGTVHVKR